MVLLTNVQGAFHGRVVAARLGAEGILTELRGAVGGIYPVGGRVEVWVDASELDDARALLLADQVEAVFDESDDEDEPRRRRWELRHRRWTWALVAAIVLLTLVATFHV